MNLAVPYAAAGTLAAPARVDLLAPFEAEYGADLLGATIVRTRGYMACRDTDVVAGVEVYLRAVSYIGNQNEIVRGSDLNDNPFDADSAWKDYWLFEPFFIGDASETAQLNVLAKRIIDVKSSRKLNELNESLILDVGAQIFAGAAGSAEMHADLSTLIMLP